ncbi:MAG: helix-turn-helix domain-containing protein [Nostoc sp.]|uniref:helix-turn-helix domain-containing protein n=1 Tax=Nostoc sp. TaxID=1180 RepID=UPI002FF39D40
MFYQFKLNPTPEQVVILETWGELLRRHWNYALGERLNWLRRTRSIIDRCSLICEFEMLPLHCLQLAVRVVTVNSK